MPVRIGPLKEGNLMGYHTKSSMKNRHHILTMVIMLKEKPLSTFRKLGALMVLSKRRAPKSSAIYRKNRDWVKRRFMKK